MLERRPFDLLPLLKEQVKLLERILPENIVIKLDYGADDYTVRADPTRMQQVLMNLAVNARDAMPEGGTLHIGLERIEIGPDEVPPLLVMRTDETTVSEVVGASAFPLIHPQDQKPMQEMVRQAIEQKKDGGAFRFAGCTKMVLSDILRVPLNRF